MATRKVKLTGIAYWCKLWESNRDKTGFEDALVDIGGQTTIDVDLDTTQMEKLKKSLSMLKGKNSEDNAGTTRVRFRRKWTEEYGGGEPAVVKADGTPWDFDTDGFIGNGSDVEITVSVYDTSRKSIVGTRLEKVKVLNHKVYDPDADDDEDEAPAPPPKAAVGKKPAPKVEFDAEDIPF
jgi:hypothetical protein